VHELVIIETGHIDARFEHEVFSECFELWCDHRIRCINFQENLLWILLHWFDSKCFCRK